MCLHLSHVDLTNLQVGYIKDMTRGKNVFIATNQEVVHTSNINMIYKIAVCIKLSF